MIFAVRMAVLFSFVALLSCSDPPPSGCPEICLCTTDGCPDQVCGFEFSLGQNCAELEPRVELFVAGCLETRDLTTAAPLVACGTLAVGETGKLTARGHDFQWGPVEQSCPSPGGLFPVTLDCEPL